MSNTKPGFHSISFPNEWGVCQLINLLDLPMNDTCFHSISFPNEWGVHRPHGVPPTRCIRVSIQLVSPTSGEQKHFGNYAVILRTAI